MVVPPRLPPGEAAAPAADAALGVVGGDSELEGVLSVTRQAALVTKTCPVKGPGHSGHGHAQLEPVAAPVPLSFLLIWPFYGAVSRAGAIGDPRGISPDQENKGREV